MGVYSTCREKTARGNVYRSYRTAHRIAVRVSRRTGGFIIAFECKACGRWHVGGVDNVLSHWDERLAEKQGRAKGE